MTLVRYYAFQNEDSMFAPYGEGDRLVLSMTDDTVATVTGNDHLNMCEEIFRRLNQDDRPNAAHFRSMSVGDVLTLRIRSKLCSYAVEPVGWRALPEPVSPTQDQLVEWHRKMNGVQTGRR